MRGQDAAMSKLPVTGNIPLYLYTFADNVAKYSDTITVIVQDNRVLLIDTAYPEYARRVKKEPCRWQSALKMIFTGMSILNFTT